jgi:hypothetical protein
MNFKAQVLRTYCTKPGSFNPAVIWKRNMLIPVLILCSWMCSWFWMGWGFFYVETGQGKLAGWHDSHGEGAG